MPERWASVAIMAALHYRTNSGKGQFIDVSSAEAFGRCINYGLTYYQGFQDVIPRVGNYDVGVFPYTYFRCKDGFAFLSGFSDINWKALCTILNRPDLQGQYPTIFRSPESGQHEGDVQGNRKMDLVPHL